MYLKSQPLGFKAGVGVGCDSCPNRLYGGFGEGIALKIYLLETSLLGNKIHKKINVALSFISSEPWWVMSEAEIGDSVYAWAYKDIENELTDVLNNIFILTEHTHVEHFYRWVALNYLSQ